MSSAIAAMSSWARARAAYIALAAVVLGAHLLPFLLTRVPLGYVYLSTDIPGHIAGVWRVSCGECFARDFFYIGDLRTLSERTILWPLMAVIGKALAIEPPAVSWGSAALFNLLGVWAAYWSLVRLTGRKVFSGALALVLLPGVQMFGGVWLGGMMGGYNTHTLAIALATWLFGAFALTASGPDGGAKSLKYFYLCALGMNVYPLVFPHLMIVMALYLGLRKLVPWKALVRTMLLSVPLAPVAIADFVLLLMRPGVESLADFREVHPFAYPDASPEFFLATGRRYLAMALAVAAMLALRRRFPARKGEDHAARPALVTLALMSFNLTIASILVEQFSMMAWQLQFSAAMCQWLFLSLFFLAAHDAARFAWPKRTAPAFLAVFVAGVFVLCSNVFYTARLLSGWAGSGATLRDRAAMFAAIRTMEPADAVFLAHPNRTAIEVRGLAGRATVVAEKDRGAAQIDATKFAEWKRLYGRVKALHFGKDVEALKAVARERGADYVILGGPEGDLAGESVVYRNAHYAVIRP